MGLPFLGWTTSGAAEAGDFNPGQGITTANRTVVGAVQADSKVITGQTIGDPNMANHAPAFWIALVVFYFAMRFFLQKDKEANWGFWGIADTTAQAIIGLSLAKWVFSTIQIPGFSSVVLSA